MSTDESAELRKLRAEVKELRRANEILKAASSFFAAELDRPQQVLVRFITDHKARFGVEPICRVLTEHGCPIAPSTYYDARQPAARPPGRVRDEQLQARRSAGSTSENYGVYGARKVWLQLNRRGHRRGPVHGRAADARAGPARRPPRPKVRTTIADAAAARAADLVRPQVLPGRAGPAVGCRLHLRPDLVRDWVYVAFVIDAYSRRILGWRAATTMNTAPGPGRPRARHLDPAARRRHRPGRADPSQRRRVAIHLDRLHRAPRSTAGIDAVDRYRRRRLRQRPRRDHRSACSRPS